MAVITRLKLVTVIKDFLTMRFRARFILPERSHSVINRFGDEYALFYQHVAIPSDERLHSTQGCGSLVCGCVARRITTRWGQKSRGKVRRHNLYECTYLSSPNLSRNWCGAQARSKFPPRELVQLPILVDGSNGA